MHSVGHSGPERGGTEFLAPKNGLRPFRGPDVTNAVSAVSYAEKDEAKPALYFGCVLYAL